MVALIFFIHSLLGEVSCQKRIVGGIDAQEGEFPFAVFIQAPSSSCTGTIIHPSHILTAAHCVGRTGFSSVYEIIAGVADLSSAEGQLRFSEYTWRHPAYNDEELLHDIAVIKTKLPFELSSRVQLLPLSPKEWPQTNDHLVRCVAAGWGYTGNSRKDSKLQKLWVTAVHGYRVCPQLSGSQERFLICLKRLSGRGICMGDSGGALICDGLGVGVASFILSRVFNPVKFENDEDMCGCQDYQDAYALICPYLTWISEHVPGIPKTPESCRANKIYATLVIGLVLISCAVHLDKI